MIRICTITATLLALLLVISLLHAQKRAPGLEPLRIPFDKGYGQVEVGGPFVGAEFHSSRPLPSRISFYYPVANSIDLSTDYWKRGESMPLAVGMEVDGDPRRWVGMEGWSYVLSPHRVCFHRVEGDFQISMTYQFCLHEPAMVRTITLRNTSRMAHTLYLYTHFKSVLRTCQTYARIDSARTRYDSLTHTAELDFDEPTTDTASVFVEDVGYKPSHVTFDAKQLSPDDAGTSRWTRLSGSLSDSAWGYERRPAFIASDYRTRMRAGDSLNIVQLIGSCRRNEVSDLARRLSTSWNREVQAYERRVIQKSESDSRLTTGRTSLDRSALWAKALLTTNAHYLKGEIVPMPCPAEYNFFFTHDVLMTDLGAVNFDLVRVKRDLQYIASLARNNIIPHAYYWRDDGFKTEYCTPDNWNHFWFILTSGAYLRHSFDSSFVRTVYPLLTASLEEILTQVKSDHLMYAFRPDWWDIGHLEGSRAYTTILSIRALREYLFISSFLQGGKGKLHEYEVLADSIQSALCDRLWDDTAQYLMNFNAGKQDEHIYMGSLLAVAFGYLDDRHSLQLVHTASQRLLDQNLGIRTVMPPDFDSPPSIAYYKFAGEEAGKPFFYINGGVWPHDNSWFALALNSLGKDTEALEFVERTMTIDGIMHSPKGQPAMYEYRFADTASPEYGMIDKPSFLWAGGYYLKTLYSLYGLSENEWNLSFHGTTKKERATYSLEFGRKKTVYFHSGGRYLETFVSGSSNIPSVVLPVDQRDKGDVYRVAFGKAGRSYLQWIDAIVHRVYRDKSGMLNCMISSFKGHLTSARVVSQSAPKKIFLDGIPMSDLKQIRTIDGVNTYQITFTAGTGLQNLQIYF